MEKNKDRELNPEQLRAATHQDGPLLILAGAGSGKTRVITNRIAWLIDEKGVAPWNIMAITFTNKAAKEMKERVERMVGTWSAAVHVATFHSTCVRILRQYIDRIGYNRNFDIYDTDDSKSLMKDICRQMEINTKIYKEKMFLARISHMKDELIDPDQCMKDAENDLSESALLVARVYAQYQRRLRMCNALDFDDLICQTVRLFREHRDVLEYYQDRWHYLMVDEYQDTNKAQFVFISLLAQKRRNLCVVGDDDQSIYRFRGADIGNILNFEKIFPETEVIRLEQNYRSTQNILDAANSVIANNRGRKSKRLWTGRGRGAPVSVKRFENASMEAGFIAQDIARMKRTGQFDYKDSAVLYRTNAQSRAIEEQLLYESIPYTIVGGTNFYARKEVKDILSYLRVISNSSDDIAVTRIINIPKRGIGRTSVARVEAYAHEHGMSFYDVARMADKIPGIGKGGLKIRQFVHLIQTLKEKADVSLPSELIRLVLDKTGYEEELRLEGTDEAKDRLENLGELLNKAAAYEASFTVTAGPEPAGNGVPAADMAGLPDQENLPDSENEIRSTGDSSAAKEQQPTLRGFLEEVSLVADIDSFDSQEDRTVLMTLHSAKGLEFPNVYIAGMDEGLFPSYQSTMSTDPADMEEERRLCYVGITRAMDHLTLTGASMRLLRGQMEWYRGSRFLSELPSAHDSLNESSARARSPYAASPKPWDKPPVKTVSRRPFMLSAGPAVETKTGGDLEYDVGDTVTHIKFGQGVVKEIRDGGRDKEVTVEFDRFGTKKMFAGFAKLKRVEV